MSINPFERRRREPGSREESTLLTDEQLSRVVRADDVEDRDDFAPAVPTRHVSNGEYMPLPQSETQKKVEARTSELADSGGEKQGIPRAPSSAPPAAWRRRSSR